MDDLRATALVIGGGITISVGFGILAGIVFGPAIVHTVRRLSRRWRRSSWRRG